jgi:hypothetical protein
VLEGIEVIVFRTTGDPPPLWESRLPPEVLRSVARISLATPRCSSSRRLIAMVS